MKHDARINRDTAVGVCKDRIEIQLFDLGMRDSERGDLEQYAFERGEVHRRLAPVTSEQRQAANLPDHRTRIALRQRRETKSDVFEHFDSHAAQTEHKSLAKLWIGSYPHDDFNSRLGHRLHGNAVDDCRRLRLLNRGCNRVESCLYFLNRAQIQFDAASVAFMHNIRRTDFQDNRKTNLECESSSFFACLREFGRRYGNASGAKKSLGFHL